MVIARRECSQTYLSEKSCTAKAVSNVSDAAVINAVTAQAACCPIATSSRVLSRTPTTELTIAYSASPKAPTMQIWPKEDIRSQKSEIRIQTTSNQHRPHPSTSLGPAPSDI